MVFQLNRFSCPSHAGTCKINFLTRLPMSFTPITVPRVELLLLLLLFPFYDYFSFSLFYLDPPINVTIISFSWSFVVINWTSPFHGRAIDFADLYRVIAKSNEEEVTVPTTETHARIDGLKQLTNYSLNVQAWNGLGYGPFLVTGILFRTPGKKRCSVVLKYDLIITGILTEKVFICRC